MKKLEVRLTLNNAEDEFVLAGLEDGLCVYLLRHYWELEQANLPRAIIVTVGDDAEPNSYPVEFMGTCVYIDDGSEYLLHAVRAVLWAHNVGEHKTYHVALWAAE